MASEDSDQLVSGDSSVHCLSDLGDLYQACLREMATFQYQFKNPCELFEVITLRRSQWIALEEWNYHVAQIFAPLHRVAVKMLSMVVVSLVEVQVPDTEELSESF
jgi:hypothetical protein